MYVCVCLVKMVDGVVVQFFFFFGKEKKINIDNIHVINISTIIIIIMNNEKKQQQQEMDKDGM